MVSSRGLQGHDAFLVVGGTGLQWQDVGIHQDAFAVFGVAFHGLAVHDEPVAEGLDGGQRIVVQGTSFSAHCPEAHTGFLAHCLEAHADFLAHCLEAHAGFLAGGGDFPARLDGYLECGLGDGPGGLDLCAQSLAGLRVAGGGALIDALLHRFQKRAEFRVQGGTSGMGHGAWFADVALPPPGLPPIPANPDPVGGPKGPALPQAAAPSA